MMDMKGTVDVSCFMLFEATGDSEADYDPIMDGVACGIARADDDDAQSCSCNESEKFNLGELNGYESCGPDSEHDDEKKEDEEEEVDGYGTSYCEDDEIQKHHKSSVSVDSGEQLLDEREKNRRFWEACLAS